MQTPGSFMILLAPFVVAFAADPNPLDIIRRSLSAQAENSKRVKNYTFLQRSEDRELDANGQIKSKKSKTYDVTMLEGTSYKRLIERDDRPLPAYEEKTEQEKLQKSIEDRRRETEAERTKRVGEYDKRPGHSRAMMNEIPDAFDFTLRGEETIDSRPAYVIEATPRAGYRPRSAEARMMLPKIKMTTWIDKADLNWVRVEAEVIDTISFGYFLFRLAKGAHLHMEQVRINNEVWLPRSVRIGGSARVALVKKLNLEQENTFKNFRKFQSDAQLAAVSAAR